MLSNFIDKATTKIVTYLTHADYVDAQSINTELRQWGDRLDRRANRPFKPEFNHWTAAIKKDYRNEN